MAKKGSPTVTKIAPDAPQAPVEPIREQEAKVAPQCRHYWLLEFPSGPTSRAVCKFCGATREFLNATDDYIYEEELASAWRPSRYRPDQD